jgi:hypothetical protein
MYNHYSTCKIKTALWQETFHQVLLVNILSAAAASLAAELSAYVNIEFNSSELLLLHITYVSILHKMDKHFNTDIARDMTISGR